MPFRQTSALIRSFGPIPGSSPRDRFVSPRARGRCAAPAASCPRRGEPVRAAPFEPAKRAIEQASKRRDVVGEQHEPEGQHPEAEDRQDGEAPANDQQGAGGNAGPTRGRLSEPAGYRLRPARQLAEKPPEAPLRVGVTEANGRGRGLRLQAPEIGSRPQAAIRIFPYAAA